MSKSFDELKVKNIKTLQQYVPIVARVHGGHHPEFHDVRKLFDAISKKTKEAGVEKPQLDNEFTQLRAITDNYTVPDDVCESYEAVYKMLEELDKAYQVQT
ncbi:MAG: iron-sulfur cluster repair di-iron protein, ric [Eubacteriales bacterium]